MPTPTSSQAKVQEQFKGPRVESDQNRMLPDIPQHMNITSKPIFNHQNNQIIVRRVNQNNLANSVRNLNIV